MLDMKLPFTIFYAGKTVSVEPIRKGNSFLFMIIFPDGTPRLAITRAVGEDMHKFWTSIPEGRQKEAERIGPLIVSHYQQLQKNEKGVVAAYQSH